MRNNIHQIKQYNSLLYDIRTSFSFLFQKMDRRYIIHNIILHYEYHNTVMLFLFKSIYILKETFSRHASFHPWSSCMYNTLQNIQAYTQTHTHLDILDTIQTMRHPDYTHWSTKVQKDHSNFIKKEIYEMKINGRNFFTIFQWFDKRRSSQGSMICFCS